MTEVKNSRGLMIITAVCLTVAGLGALVLAAMILQMPATAYDGELL